MTDVTEIRLAEVLERVLPRARRRARRDARKAALLRAKLDELREHVSGDPANEKLVDAIVAKVNRLLAEAYGQ